MKRLAVGAAIIGLGLMGSTALVACKSADGLESRILMFLVGVSLLVLGGSGYTATEPIRPASPPSAARRAR